MAYGAHIVYAYLEIVEKPIGTHGANHGGNPDADSGRSDEVLRQIRTAVAPEDGRSENNADGRIAFLDQGKGGRQCCAAGTARHQLGFYIGWLRGDVQAGNTFVALHGPYIFVDVVAGVPGGGVKGLERLALGSLGTPLGLECAELLQRNPACE